VFTGIIQFTGVIKKLVRVAGGLKLSLITTGDISSLRIGDSIAVNGVCLTVVEKNSGEVTVDVAEETVKRTTLSKLRLNEVVNLELPLTPLSPLGGHIVQGHVDCVARIAGRRREGSGERITIEVPEEWSKYVVEKGSIAVDGMSLTVARKNGNRIEIAIIPHTLKNTNISFKKTGSYVNIEVDIIGKYVYNFLQNRVKERW